MYKLLLALLLAVSTLVVPFFSPQQAEAATAKRPASIHYVQYSIYKYDAERVEWVAIPPGQDMKMPKAWIVFPGALVTQMVEQRQMHIKGTWVSFQKHSFRYIKFETFYAMQRTAKRVNYAGSMSLSVSSVSLFLSRVDYIMVQAKPGKDMSRMGPPLPTGARSPGPRSMQWSTPGYQSTGSSGSMPE
jgi:hypothetical protein